MLFLLRNSYVSQLFFRKLRQSPRSKASDRVRHSNCHKSIVTLHCSTAKLMLFSIFVPHRVDGRRSLAGPAGRKQRLSRSISCRFGVWENATSLPLSETLRQTSARPTSTEQFRSLPLHPPAKNATGTREPLTSFCTMVPPTLVQATTRMHMNKRSWRSTPSGVRRSI